MNKLATDPNFKLPEDFDAFVIGSFTDCFECPPHVRKFISKLPNSAVNEKYCALLNAHGGDSGLVVSELNCQLIEKGAHPVSAAVVKYCNNYPGLTYPKNDKEVQGILESGLAVVAPAAKRFHAVLTKQEQFTPLTLGIKARIGQTLFSGLLKGIGNHMGKTWVVD